MDSPTRMIAAAAAGGLVMTGITVAVTLAGVDTGNAGLAAVGRAAMVIVPVAVGCYAWRRWPERRFGVLLVAVGFGWFLTTFAESDNELLYSIGRLAGWFVEVELIYLALSFPTGRLPERIDRILVAAALALVAVLYLPTALIGQDFPLPAPYTSCASDCPPNAFFVLDSEPGFVDSIVRPLREVLTAIVFLAVTARLAQRVRRSTRLMRKTLTPVLAVAVARFFIVGMIVIVRRVDAGAPALEAFNWVAALGLPAMAAGFFVGLIRWRLFVATSLQELGIRIRDGTDVETLRAALADAMSDPSLRLVYWADSRDGRWVDADGNEVRLPGPGSGQLATEIRDGDRRIAAILHDEALHDQEELLQAAAGYARIALNNRRLYAQVEASLAEVRESRARIVASADRERRRIERDLHDGAQQRLVALRIKLELAGESLGDDPDADRARLHSLGDEVEATVDEIRALAHGVYPPLLADQGLAEALRAVALRAPLATTVSADGIGRYPSEVESAVYFCCLEALQNAAKHADGATRVSLSLAEDERLQFQVRDDGAGFDASDLAGAGLTNMRDRISAVGGDLVVASPPGRGVLVTGSVPIGGGLAHHLPLGRVDGLRPRGFLAGRSAVLRDLMDDDDVDGEDGQRPERIRRNREQSPDGAEARRQDRHEAAVETAGPEREGGEELEQA
jgi:signal transduction histidine kinase